MTQLYYMPRYICPWLNTRKARLFGMGDEHVQCVLRPDGWIDQMKNAIREAFRLTATHIQRGSDTSDLWTPDGLWRGNYYTQYTEQPDGTLTEGADWIPIWFAQGQTFTRKPRVIRRWWDKREIANYTDVTTIRFVQHHATWRFPHPDALELTDVIELNWGGEENYFYPADLGLGGWQNLRTGAGSFIGSFSSVVIQQPHPEPIPRPQVAAPPKEYPNMPTNSMHRLKVTGFPPNIAYRNIRTSAGATTPESDIGDLNTGDVVDVVLPATNTGWASLTRLSDGVQGWVLWTGVQTEAVTTPPVPKTYSFTEAQMTELRRLTKQQDDTNAAIVALLDSAEVTVPGVGNPF